MADELIPFSTRIRKDQERRLMELVAASGSDFSKSDITRLALDHLFAVIEISPNIIPGYDAKRDKSARRKGRRQDNGGN